jgi:cytochrome c biogenesis protein CcmG/thiol:disulfide interchange protein DsbE
MRLFDMMRRACLAAAVGFSLSVPLSAHAMASKGNSPPPVNVWSLSGQNITLSNYRGRVLLIDFFATHCEPCRRSIPHIVDLYGRYSKQGLQVLGVSLDKGKEKDVAAYVTAKKIYYPVAMADDEIVEDYGIRSIPTLFVINKKGMIVERYPGFNEDIAKSMEALIKKLLAE